MLWILHVLSLLRIILGHRGLGRFIIGPKSQNQQGQHLEFKHILRYPRPALSSFTVSYLWGKYDRGVIDMLKGTCPTGKSHALHQRRLPSTLWPAEAGEGCGGKTWQGESPCAPAGDITYLGHADHQMPSRLRSFSGAAVRLDFCRQDKLKWLRMDRKCHEGAFVSHERAVASRAFSLQM